MNGTVERGQAGPKKETQGRGNGGGRVQEGGCRMKFANAPTSQLRGTGGWRGGECGVAESCISSRNARGARDMAVKERRKSVASTKGVSWRREKGGVGVRDGRRKRERRLEMVEEEDKERGRENEEGGIPRQREVVRACAHHFCRGAGTSLIRRRRGNAGENPGVEDPRRGRK